MGYGTQTKRFDLEHPTHCARQQIFEHAHSEWPNLA